MRAVRAAFDRFFYVPLDPIRWGVVRIVVAVIGLYWLRWGGPLAGAPRGLAQVPEGMRQPMWLMQPFITLVGGVPSDRLLDGMQGLLAVGFGLLAIGFRTRIVTWVVVPTGLLYYGTLNSFATPIFTLNCAYYLMLLLGLFADWGAALSVDAARRRVPVAPSERYGVVLRTAHALAALLMLTAALHKMIAAPMWLTGGQLWRYLIETGMEPRETVEKALKAPHLFKPVTTFLPWLIAHPGVVRLAEIGTLVFEGTFFLSFFFPRLVIPYVLAALSFHIGIYLAVPAIGGVTFLPYYAAMLPWERLRRRAAPPVVSEPPAFRRRGALTVAFFLGTQLAASLLADRHAWQRRLWPFNDMRMFTWRTEVDRANRIKLVYVEEGGERRLLDTRKVYHPTLGGSLEIFSNPLNPIHLPSYDDGLVKGAQAYRCAQGWGPGALQIEAWSWAYLELAQVPPVRNLQTRLVRRLNVPAACP